jgi:transcription elongation factor Elf1
MKAVGFIHCRFCFHQNIIFANDVLMKAKHQKRRNIMSKKISAKAKKEYIGGAYGCPFCNSGNIISPDSLMDDMSNVKRIMMCEDCGKKWLEIYTISDIIEV